MTEYYRTNAYLTKSQRKAMEVLKQRFGISHAKILRRALNRYLMDEQEKYEKIYKNWGLKDD